MKIKIAKVYSVSNPNCIQFKVDMGDGATWSAFFDNGGWNIKALKFSEIIWYDSDQHANQAGIESNINDHYSIY